MSLSDEKKILERMNKNFRGLNATELSALIKKLPTEEQAIFTKTYHDKMPLCVRAEEYIKSGRVNQAIEMLNHAVSRGYYGNEYAYGLFGDAYLKKGETKRAIEFYKKSGSIDSLKKIKIMGAA